MRSLPEARAACVSGVASVENFGCITSLFCCCFCGTARRIHTVHGRQIDTARETAISTTEYGRTLADKKRCPTAVHKLRGVKRRVSVTPQFFPCCSVSIPIWGCLDT